MLAQPAELKIRTTAARRLIPISFRVANTRLTLRALWARLSTITYDALMLVYARRKIASCRQREPKRPADDRGAAQVSLCTRWKQRSSVSVLCVQLEAGV